MGRADILAVALVMCPECSRQVSSHAGSCPACGYPIANGTQAQKSADNHVHKTLGFWETLEGYSIRDEVICPHCGKRGCVATKRVKAKKGISGAKATGALLTGGLSMFATGLSRKELVTDARCKNCRSRWQF